MKKLSFSMMGSAALALLPATAPAAEKALLDILLANGAIDQQQYEQLLAQEELTVEDVEGVAVNLDEGGFIVESENFELGIGGRLHTDYVHHDYDSRIGEAPVNGTQLRRARIEMNGVIRDNWEWAAEADFAGDEVEVKEFKLGYVADNGFSLFAGHQKQPYSLALEMSSNDIPFIERSVDNALVAPFTDRAIGLRAEHSGSNWFAAGGIFGEASESGAAGDEGWGTSARAVFAPVIEDGSVVHLGFRGAYRETADLGPSVSIDDETSDFSDLSIVDTGVLENTESVTLMGPEFAVAIGPFSLYGEYNRARLERTGSEELEFDSWHVASTWSLTGESRASAYRIDAGEFKGIAPARDFDLGDGGWGAWELAATYAGIDLNDADVQGGSEETLAAELNWYPNANVRFLFNWTHILDTDESNLLRLHAPGMDIFSLRAQYAY